MAHWKVLKNPDYIGAYVLEDMRVSELIVEIIGVRKGKVKGEDGKESECVIADLRGQKPMILNATNCKTIESIYQTPFTENWVGKLIKIYIANIRVAGRPVVCLRIRAEIPVIKLPELTPTHDKWAGAKQAIKDGTAKIDDVKKKYSITPENEQLLLTNAD